MRITAHRSCERQIKKLTSETRAKMYERIALLHANPHSTLLNDHKLSPPYDGYRSINVTGDYRLVYKKIDTETYYLRAVGTHHQLYGK